MKIKAFNCSEQCKNNIQSVINFLKIDEDYTVEMYFGENIEERFGNVYGDEIFGVYLKDDKMFFKDEDIETVAHEFSHLKFNKMYCNNGNIALDFIDEYLAKRTGVYIKPFFNISRNNSIEFLKYKASYIKEQLEKLNNILKITKNQFLYMRTIANMLVWRDVLIQMKEYKYDMQYDLLTGLSTFNNCFEGIDYYNVLEKYKKISAICRDHMADKMHLFDSIDESIRGISVK